jgi:hypothetical protein
VTLPIRSVSATTTVRALRVVERAALFQSLNDPNIAHRTISQCFQRFLVSRTVIGGRRFLETRKFDNYRPLFEPGFKSNCSVAKSSYRWEREFGIGGELFRIRYRAIGD